MGIKKKSSAMKALEDISGRPLTLGGLLESIRLADDVSQSAYAKKLKISATHLCDIEKGRKVVSPERAARFAKILKYSEEQFVRLALQALIDQSGLKMYVDVKTA